MCIRCAYSSPLAGEAQRASKHRGSFPVAWLATFPHILGTNKKMPASPCQNSVSVLSLTCQTPVELRERRAKTKLIYSPAPHSPVYQKLLKNKEAAVFPSVLVHMAIGISLVSPFTFRFLSLLQISRQTLG